MCFFLACIVNEFCHHIMQHIISSELNGHHTLFIELLVQEHEAYNKLHVS
jgi:hypothetical protein